jgi:hypothetical protein
MKPAACWILTAHYNLSETDYNIAWSVNRCLLTCLNNCFSHCFQLYCLLVLQYGSHSKKRPNNLVLGRTYDHHVYDLVEVGIENYKSMESFVYDKKLAPKLGSKPFFAFIGGHFESSEELKHLKEVLLDLFRGEVCHFVNTSWFAGHGKSLAVFNKLVMLSAGCRKSKPCWR